MPSSTGGGRAWSEQEVIIPESRCHLGDAKRNQETYLIETRLHKMPYKHIAAQLHKTELACRLHYHQLSFGTKRRRRGSSVSSARSVPLSIASDPLYLNQRQLPALSPPESPGRHSRAVSSRDSSPNNPIPILPKPAMGMISHRNTSHPITHDVECTDEYTRINKDRLTQIYNAHRCAFWNAMAREYGDNVNPMVLEDTWRRICASQFGFLPPTPPDRSPHTPNSRPVLEPRYVEAPLPSIFTSVNTSGMRRLNTPPRSSFAISSLLTENRDVRGSRSLMA